MTHAVQPFPQPREDAQEFCLTGPGNIADLEADNASLRITLAQSEGHGERRELVMAELKHRIGNLLAVVQAMARQTFQDADSASIESFAARLHALGAAQKFLVETDDNVAMLTNVVERALAPHCAEGDRCSVQGPDVQLSGRHAHALTLALHELATNATNYGALSVASGRIDVSWTYAAGRLEFLWREHGGPRVEVPTRRGFGSMLITRNLALTFAGEVDLQFNAGGVQCRFSGTLAADTPDA